MAVRERDVSNGELSLSADGGFTYTPDGDFSGTDSFTYVVSDGLQTSPAVTVTVSVLPVNDPPVAEDDVYGVVINVPFSVDASDGVLDNDEDADGDGLAVELVTDVSNGTLDLASNGAFTYTPAQDFEGDDTFVYRVSDGQSDGTATVTLSVGPDLGTVVINEIMYHPTSDNDLEEFIEIANIGENAVDLEGWEFTSGVSFTFPAVTLPAGGFVVVAADVASFESVYGEVPGLVGGWTGRLSNSGERVRLKNAAGLEVDDLTYADQGEWAQRERVSDARGWDWNGAHDGGGSSLELILASVSNKHGQNWSASEGAPTPGAGNSVVAEQIAPMILDVEHRPVVPKSDEPVTITARLLSAEPDEALAAQVFWRAAPQNPGGFSSIPMSDDGDGNYAVTLPAMPDGTVIEFYVSASDSSLSRTWPPETNIGQVANAHYIVDDEVYEGHFPLYRIVMTGDEDDAWLNVARRSNERFHATLILDDCSGPVVRYNSSIRVRGAGSRNHTPPPMRVTVPSDNLYNDRSAMNWNTKYTYSQYIGMRLFQGSGLAAPDGKPARVRWSGEDRMRGDDFDFGFAVHLEVLDGDYIDDKYPEDSDGNLYKKVRPDNDWAWRDGNIPDYLSDGWSKETNSDENDWADLDAWLDVMNNAPGNPDYVRQVEAVVDLDQWLQWFGTMAILANGETNASTGTDDDFSVYSGVLDPRIQMQPHDLDTIFGDGDGSRITDPEHTVFDMISRGDSLAPLVPLFSNAEVRLRYFQALRELLQGSFSKSEFDELVNNSLAGWVPQGDIDDIITFMDARRIFINGLVDAELGEAPPVTTATTAATLVSSHGDLMISEVLASNSSFDHFGTFPDYVEIFNAGASAINLSNIGITDDLDELGKFTFPAGTTLSAGQYMIIFGASDASTPGMHLGFGVGANGDSIHLTNGGAIVDSVSFGLQIPDHSIGRTGANLNIWQLGVPTPLAANVAQAVGDPERSPHQ